MKFGLILAGVTIGTLVLIFGFYKLFLEKPPIAAVKTPSQSAQVQATPSATLIATPTPTPLAPAASAQPGSISRISPAPSGSRSTIGTITTLQDTTSNSSSSFSGGSNISGTLGFSGSAPSGTSVVVVAKRSGSADSYKTVVGGISPSNGSAWSWTGASSGTNYEMIAILKGSTNGVDTDYAMSQTYIVTAPAYSQLFSLTASTPPAQPSGTITTTCSNKNGNSWNVTVNFPQVAGVQWYKLQVGTSSGGSDIMNTSQAASSMSPSSTATFTDSVIYYAQFAVANAATPTDYQYSAFSTPQTIKCP